MDANNFCGICEDFKPCVCDVKTYKFDTSEYITLAEDGTRHIPDITNYLKKFLDFYNKNCYTYKTNTLIEKWLKSH